MMKYIDISSSVGKVTILSAEGFPVGGGWGNEGLSYFANRGITVRLRKFPFPTSLQQLYGVFYAFAQKACRKSNGFGHANPYHRFAFPKKWIINNTSDLQILLINYSFWAHLEVNCPKIVILHDLWSEKMTGGIEIETRELMRVNHIWVISKTEEDILRTRGLVNLSHSPPLVPAQNFPDSTQVGLTGSNNQLNIEGLRWLEAGQHADCRMSIQVYGSISNAVERKPFLCSHGHYADRFEPYRQSGIILIPTALGTGVQIKAVEALACGRAIIARRGAMRGLPADKIPWTEVDTATEMIDQAVQLQGNVSRRRSMQIASAGYYADHLEANKISDNIKNTIQTLMRS